MSKQESIPTPMIYEVQIKRNRNLGGIFPSYQWDVSAYKDGGFLGPLFNTGGSYTIESAKRKAVKHIIGVEKELDKGVTFGLIFTVSGTAQQIKDQLDE